jgi:hypothetical protein
LQQRIKELSAEMKTVLDKGVEKYLV